MQSQLMDFTCTTVLSITVADVHIIIHDIVHNYNLLLCVNFSYRTFNILGIHNCIRGGCGRHSLWQNAGEVCTWLDDGLGKGGACKYGKGVTIKCARRCHGNQLESCVAHALGNEINCRRDNL